MTEDKSFRLFWWLCLTCVGLAMSRDFSVDTVFTHMHYVEGGVWERMWAAPSLDTVKVQGEGAVIWFGIGPLLTALFVWLGEGAFVYALWMGQTGAIAWCVMSSFKVFDKKMSVALTSAAMVSLAPFYTMVTLNVWCVFACVGMIRWWSVRRRAAFKTNIWRAGLLCMPAISLLPIWLGVCFHVWLKALQKYRSIWVLSLTSGLVALFVVWSKQTPEQWWLFLKKTVGPMYARPPWPIVSIALVLVGVWLLWRAWHQTPKHARHWFGLWLGVLAVFTAIGDGLGQQSFSSIHKIGFATMAVWVVVSRANFDGFARHVRIVWAVSVASLALLFTDPLAVAGWRELESLGVVPGRGFVAEKTTSDGEVRVVTYSSNDSNRLPCPVIRKEKNGNVVLREIQISCHSLVGAAKKLQATKQ
jgi:hypothetical protein